MLIAEARWLGAFLARLPDDAFPLANIGSQTEEFQYRTQPWIMRYVFDPLKARGIHVINVDQREDPGVDIVADITTEVGQDAVRRTGAATILCSNVLEHVSDPNIVLQSLLAAVPPGGMLIVSGPIAFPYHPDPIDTMFRPTWDQIANLIGPGFVVVDGADLVCRRLVTYDTMTWRGRLRVLARVALPFLKPSGWRQRVKWLATRTSCYVIAVRREA